MTNCTRLVVLAATVLLLATAATIYGIVRRDTTRGAAAAAGTIDLGAPGQIIFRNMRHGPEFGLVASVP